MATVKPTLTRDWEQTFREWSKPSSDSEQQRMENAERMIREAIRESKALSNVTVEVFAQGSYRNNTNVRQDSDVDICVRCMSTLFDDYSMSNDLTRADTGLVPSNYHYATFKQQVLEALETKFGKAGVRRGKKAIDIHANSYRVDADVVPTFEHRRYLRSESGQIWYQSGTEFWCDDGRRIINWPNQHYENGVQKNIATKNRYKFITRAIKRMRNEMAEVGIEAAKPIPSYLIECLVWNVPNPGFGHDRYVDDVRYVLAHTINFTLKDSECAELGEVNELKYLFHAAQPWNRVQVHSFLSAAWDYVGFE